MKGNRTHNWYVKGTLLVIEFDSETCQWPPNEPVSMSVAGLCTDACEYLIFQANSSIYPFTSHVESGTSHGAFNEDTQGETLETTVGQNPVGSKEAGHPGRNRSFAGVHDGCGVRLRILR